MTFGEFQNAYDKFYDAEHKWSTHPSAHVMGSFYDSYLENPEEYKWLEKYKEGSSQFDQGGITVDSREEYRGIGYEILHKTPEGYYVRPADWESTIIFSFKHPFFDKAYQAKEHAELEINWYLMDAEEKEEDRNNNRIRFKEGGQTQLLKSPPPGTQIQSIILDNKYFQSERSVKTWAWKHKKKSNRIESTKSSFILEQEDPSKYRKDSFKIVELAKGINAKVGYKKSSAKSKVKK